MRIIPLAVNNPLQNYIWLIINDKTKQAIAVDPTCADTTRAYVVAEGLDLVAVWVTHDHHDHVAGIPALKAAFPQCHIVSHEAHKLPKGVLPTVTVSEGSVFHCWGYPVQVWSLEGHKRFHVGYLIHDHDALMTKDTQHKQANRQHTSHSDTSIHMSCVEIQEIATMPLHVFSGDILFSAGCGRNFEGSVQQLYDSLQRLASLPDGTLFYPTHEFTVNNLTFALQLCPEDRVLQDAFTQAKQRRDANQCTLPTTMANEKRINIFLRTHEPLVKQAVHSAGGCGNRPERVFAELRALKDAF